MEEIFKPDFSNINIDKTIPTISISAVLGMLEKPFDKMGIAQKTFNNHFNNEKSEYYHMTVDQIIEKWENKGAESRRYGSMLDDYIGNVLKGTEATLRLFKLDNNYEFDDRLHGLCDSFDNFYKILCKSGDTVFVDRERTVYYKVEIPNPLNEGEKLTYYVKGRFDALFYNKRTKKWIVIDWKSSGSIDKVPTKWTERLLGPMSKYYALNYYTYTTQLYFYKKALVDEGYLPEGTSYDDVVVMIVNLPGKIIEESGINFGTHTAAYEFDTDLMDRLYKFSIEKDYINKSLEKEKQKEEYKEEPTQNKEESINLENIF